MRLAQTEERGQPPIRSTVMVIFESCSIFSTQSLRCLPSSS
jgi:hypothetical protein